jgi:hypothetical protein
MERPTQRLPPTHGASSYPPLSISDKFSYNTNSESRVTNFSPELDDNRSKNRGHYRDNSSYQRCTLFIEAIAFVAPFMAPATAVFACMAYFIPPILQAIVYKSVTMVLWTSYFYKRSSKHRIHRFTTQIRENSCRATYTWIKRLTPPFSSRDCF